MPRLAGAPWQGRSKKRKKEKKYYMYVVQCGDHTQSLYCGISTDPERRLKEHNESNKKGAKYTRSRRPVRLMFTQECESRSDALKKEAAFKKLSRDQKLKYMCEYIEEQMMLQIANAPQMKEVDDSDKAIDKDSKPNN